MRAKLLAGLDDVVRNSAPTQPPAVFLDKRIKKIPSHEEELGQQGRASQVGLRRGS